MQNMYDIKIDSGVCLPQKKQSMWREIFSKMNVGDSFSLPYNASDASCVRSFVVGRGMKIATRRDLHKGTIRFWLLEKKDAPQDTKEQNGHIAQQTNNKIKPCRFISSCGDVSKGELCPAPKCNCYEPA